MLQDITRRCARWWRDPLFHPDIARMSERERADLPFDPAALSAPASGPDQARP
ncbi:MAG: hypothetical protein H6898_07925 [Rhodobacter sp.]|nr:hypothetical protein [Paracoccaceae bacterium]MCC0076500.1 hypothetical protein [Rhodobacter sp.]